MSRWTRAVAGAMGVLASLSMLAGPVEARQRNFLEHMFNPPAGLQLTTGKPTNSLQLRTGTVKLHPRFMRQVVAYSTREEPGTIVVNTGEKFLYLVLGKGKALRYGIGTARSGFEWSGSHRLTAKREWPGWTPPAEMRRRQPGLPSYMEGGVNNPLGARALYIGSTLYRIHGTNEPWSIGTNVSSGCIRMVNDDVVDLYERVKIGAKVVVL
jgi:lipoprotein-anchoring transpeptidase ErfK/SrfK